MVSLKAKSGYTALKRELYYLIGKYYRS